MNVTLKKRNVRRLKYKIPKKLLGSIIEVYKNTWLNKFVEINKHGQGRYRGNFLSLTKEEKRKNKTRHTAKAAPHSSHCEFTLT